MTERSTMKRSMRSSSARPTRATRAWLHIPQQRKVRWWCRSRPAARSRCTRYEGDPGGATCSGLDDFEQITARRLCGESLERKKIAILADSTSCKGGIKRTRPKCSRCTRWPVIVEKYGPKGRRHDFAAREDSRHRSADVRVVIYGIAPTALRTCCCSNGLMNYLPITLGTWNNLSGGLLPRVSAQAVRAPDPSPPSTAPRQQRAQSRSRHTIKKRDFPTPSSTLTRRRRALRPRR
jgi:hypothetical protein